MIELEEGYYQIYFETMLAEVKKNYSDLFSEAETNFIQTYEHLPDASKKLYLRLFMRSGPWFLLDKLQYKEIPNIKSAIRDLLAVSLVTLSPDTEEPEFWNLFKVGELRELLGAKAKCHSIDIVEIKKMPKANLISLILALPENSRQSFLATIKESYVKILESEHASLIPLLFFGNHQQGITDFVLEGIGQRKFEQIVIDRTTRLFSDRNHLERRRYLRKWKDLIWAYKESKISPSDSSAWKELENMSLAVLKEIKTWESSDAYLYAHSFLNIAQYFEKHKKTELAYLFYQETCVPPSRERQARHLRRLKKNSESENLALQMYHHPQNLDERDKAEKLLKKWAVEMFKSVDASVIFTSRKICVSLGEKKVEEHTLDYFREHGWEGSHVENSVWNHLFGLAFWTAIFLPIPGAFANRFQGGPRDLWEASFYQARREVIEKLIQVHWVSNETLISHLNTIYIEKNGLFNFLTSWNSEVHHWAIKIAKSLPIGSLKKIIRRILENPGDLLKGFPDLVLENTSSGELLLVEVKGPGDRLRTEQEQWLRFFTSAGVACELVWVERRKT